MDMAKRRRKKGIGKKEFIFNLFSLIIVICIGLYFGARSFYYYSKQNTPIASSVSKLSDKLLSDSLNSLISSLK